MIRKTTYREVIGYGPIEDEIHNVIRQFTGWEHEIIGYSRTSDQKRGERSSVLIKFFKTVEVKNDEEVAE